MERQKNGNELLSAQTLKRENQAEACIFPAFPRVPPLVFLLASRPLAPHHGGRHQLHERACPLVHSPLPSPCRAEQRALIRPHARGGLDACEFLELGFELFLWEPRGL